MLRLVFVNLLFALLLVVFLLAPVTNNWAWLGLLTSWFLAEAWLSRDRNILWWQWALLFLSLGALDAAIVLLLR